MIYSTRLALSFALAFSLIVGGCASAPLHRSATVVAVQKLTTPLTLAEVERSFGPATQGHGPVSWYPCSDQEHMELWFWWLPPKPKRDIRSRADVVIAYVTITPKNKENIQTFIWPVSARHLDANAILNKLYRNIQ